MVKINITFDPTTSVFYVQFDRGQSLAEGDPLPPPPPFNEQIAEMTKWLNENYSSVLAKFNDKEISGLQLTFQATKR